MKASPLITSEVSRLSKFDETLSRTFRYRSLNHHLIFPLGSQLSAEALYTPMIDRKKKSAKIRAALVVLDSYKFFFSLPNSLTENIKKVRHYVC